MCFESLYLNANVLLSVATFVAIVAVVALVVVVVESTRSSGNFICLKVFAAVRCECSMLSYSEYSKLALSMST